MNLLFLNHNLREHGTYFRAFHLGRELVARGHRVTLLTASPDHWYRPRREFVDGVEIVETPSWNPFFNCDDGFGPLDTLYRLGVVLKGPGGRATSGRAGKAMRETETTRGGKTAGWRRGWDALYAFAHPPNVLLPHWLFRLLHPGAPVAVDWCDLYGGTDGIVARRRALWRTNPSSRPASLLARTAQRLAWAVEPRAEQHIARHAPRLTVISSFLHKQALHLGVPTERLLRLPSGAPLDTIRPRDKAECRARLDFASLAGCSGKTPLLVYIANYHPDEEFFLASLGRAKARLEQDGQGRLENEESAPSVASPSAARSRPPFRLCVVGPPFSEGAIRHHGLADEIVEIGRRPFAEIDAWLGAADLLLLPYPRTLFNRSRWPNKIGDYLAAGRPTLTNRTGDFIPLFERFDIGLSAESTPEDYARAIVEALRSPARWDDWGRTARRVAEGPLSWSRLAARLERFWLGDITMQP